MKSYVKLIDKNRIEFAPSVLEKDKFMMVGYNMETNEEMLLKDGYKILVDNACKKDGKTYDEHFTEDKKIITRNWVEHIFSDWEIENIRNDRYENYSDKILVRVQRGAVEPKEYIAAVARIKSENKYSYEAEYSYEDYYNEAARMWNEANPSRMVEILNAA